MIRRRILRPTFFNAGRRFLSSNAARSSDSTAPVLRLSDWSGRLASRARSFPVNPYHLTRCCFSSQAMLDFQEGGIVHVPLAQTGEGIAECELLRWFVKEGDLVDEFQPLCEVQSDKATIEITSRYNGRVAKVLHDPGSIVKVGATLLKMSVDDYAAPVDASNEFSNAPPAESVISDTNAQSSLLNKNKTEGVLSTPSVRSIAKQYGINIDEVAGSGKDGRVLKEDVLRFAAKKGLIEESSSSKDDESVKLDGTFLESSSAPAANVLQYIDTRVPVRGYQRAMVKTMTAAAKIPHFHYVEEINCDALVKLKATFQNENTDPAVKHTFLPSLIKSLSLAMSKFPYLNACFDENSQEIILKGSHNIGIAMATPHGLVVPNIKKVQSLSILEITKELSRLQLLAQDNKLGPEDVSGGTITLSNIGSIGGKFGSPLLNLPEVAIIAMGRIEKVPRFDNNGNVYPSSIMTVNMGADHRVLDGAVVARFCNEWKSHIEKPELLLLQLR
uniref:Dihydrolipoamide acetyltransferase component of pyruvate dehydrogenase complex n=1 Tax=Kalanchoe fedtschenkoi TaxID=63787 RepID=A0A7N0UJ96_KALFE